MKRLQTASELLKRAGLMLSVERPYHEARLLLGHVLGWPVEKIIAYPEKRISIEEEEAFFKLLQRRQQHEPIAKIKGEKEFWGLPFYTSLSTLDPRPETELLIESVLEYFPKKTESLSLLDLGTGTGCLLLSLLREYSNAFGIGVDLSRAALKVAQANAARLSLSSRLAWVQGRWASAVQRKFDVIVSNPPYIAHSTIASLDPGVKNYDPMLALSGGEDGLEAYRVLSSELTLLCDVDSLCILEIGQGQREAVEQLFSSSWHLVNCKADLQGIERCLVFKVK